MFHVLPQMLEAFREDTGVTYRKGPKNTILSGTFIQIEAAHTLLQFFSLKVKVGHDAIRCGDNKTKHPLSDRNNQHLYVIRLHSKTINSSNSVPF